MSQPLPASRCAVGRSVALTRAILVVVNVLSGLRLALALSFPFLPSEGHYRVTVVAVGGLSDALDGFLARRFKATSWAGGLLDAIADKAFVLAVLLTLTLDAAVPLEPWHVVLLLSRDVAVAAVAGYVALRRAWPEFRRMPSRPLGKATTVGQFAVMLAALVWREGVGWLLVPAVALSILAAGDYLWLCIVRLRAMRDEKEREHDGDGAGRAEVVTVEDVRDEKADHDGRHGWREGSGVDGPARPPQEQAPE
jgi:cardiolipin synthase (CMP-forming)